MAGPVLEIPGMYWDEEKKKYFKITANHLAPSQSAGAAYTVQSVKRKREEAVKNTKKRHFKELTEHAINKSGIVDTMGFSATAGNLARELGTIRGSQIDDLRSRISAMEWEQTEIQLRLDHSHVMGSWSPCFDWDPEKQHLYIPNGLGQIAQYRAIEMDDERRVFTQINQNNSLEVIPGISTVKVEQVEWLPGLQRVATLFRNGMYGGYLRTLDPGNPMETNSSHEFYVNRIAKAPHAWPYAFAAATTTGFAACCSSRHHLAYDPRNGRNQTRRELNRRGMEHIQAVAVDFLPHTSPETAIVGYRNGNIRCHDERTRKGKHRTESNLQLEHPVTITNLKAIDEYRILATGASSTMAQYDLRYLKSDLDHHVWDVSKHKGFYQERCSKTILQYSDYDNAARLNLGFSVDLDAGLIATAHDKEGDPACVKIFSLHGGQVLRTLMPQWKGISKHEAEQGVEAMRFVDDSHGRHPNSLFLIKAKKLLKFGV